MRGVADDGLVEVADLDFDLAVGVGYRAEVADVAVAADPDGRALRELVAGAGLEPFVELEGVAADVGVGRTCHLEPAALFQDCLAFGRLDCYSFFSHQPVLAENSHWRYGRRCPRQAQLSTSGAILRYTASFTASSAAGFFARVVVMTTTLMSTNMVPRIVRRPRASPPRRYPSSTATTGFT